jgi:hypothetical protein
MSLTFMNTPTDEAKVIMFPPKDWVKPKTLEDWPWDKELGTPHGVSGDVGIREPVNLLEQAIFVDHANPPEAEVNDLARFREPTPINPSHYRTHPSGVECIQITEHMGFCEGNAIKYIWRAGRKIGADRRQDLEKAIWYLQRELRK